MTTRTRYTVTVTERDLPALLDMLRYDRAVVETWAGPIDEGTYWRWFTVSLSSEHPALDRWASFGLVAKVDPR